MLKKNEETEVSMMFEPRYKLTYDERRIIVLCLIEMKNKLIRENRYTGAIDDLLVKFMDQLSFKPKDEYMTLHNPVRGYFSIRLSEKG